MVCMSPEKQSISLLNHEIDLLTNRQAQLSGDMTKRQIGQHGHFDLATQPINHACSLEAFVMRSKFVMAELPQNHRFLLRQNTHM